MFTALNVVSAYSGGVRERVIRRHCRFNIPQLLCSDLALLSFLDPPDPLVRDFALTVLQMRLLDMTAKPLTLLCTVPDPTENVGFLIGSHGRYWCLTTAR